MGNYVRRGYHCAPASWRNASNLVGDYVGIELEVESRTTEYQDLLDLLPDFKNRTRSPVTEEDGSLSESRGVEIIFPPVKLRNLLRKGSVFSQCIEALDGMTRDFNGAGMHMNVNTVGWSYNKQALFGLVVNTMPVFVLQALGGRATTSYCTPYGRYWNKSESYPTGHILGCLRPSHSWAAEIRPSRIEMRFPKGTTDKARIKMLLTFINQLTAFSDKNQQDRYIPFVALSDFLSYLTKSKAGRELRTYMGYKDTLPNDSKNSIAAPATSLGGSDGAAASNPEQPMPGIGRPSNPQTVQARSQLGVIFGDDYYQRYIASIRPRSSTQSTR